MILSVSDLLEYFVSSSEITSPKEFLDRYCSPTDVTLDRGMYVKWSLSARGRKIDLGFRGYEQYFSLPCQFCLTS